MEQESNIHTMNCEKIVVCMDHSTESNMIITGHEDGVMRLWDPRSKGIFRIF
jgi:ribosome biogenesis protein